MTDDTKFDVGAFKNFERDGYSGVAEAYDRAIAKITSQANPAILEAVGAGPGKAILDVACGPGWLSEAALGCGATVDGVDFAKNMVKLASARNPAGQFREGDAENLPYQEAEFDAVVCSCGILHFPNPESAMSEAFRVLKSGGRYAITCWRPPAQDPLFALILGSVQAHGTMDLDLPDGPPLFRFGEEAECKQALEDAGFVSVETTELPVVWIGDSPESVLEEIASSGARLGPILNQQRPDDREKIEAAILEGARAYITAGGGVEIPAPVLLTCGRKP